MSEEREAKNRVFTQGMESGLVGAHTAGAPQIPAVSIADKLRSEFGITIPAEIVKLPSGGKVYPESSGLYLREDVSIKALTTREEDILTSRALLKKGTVITELIRSCVTDKSLDINQLIAGDRNAIMVAIRITGYGEKYEIEMQCPNPECGEKVPYAFNLSELALKPLEADPIAPGVNEFSFKLPTTKADVTFKLLTGQDEEELMTQQERRKKLSLGKRSASGSVIDSNVSDQLKASIISVNGIRDRGKLSWFVDEMIGQDSLALREYMKSIQPGVEMKQMFTCSACNHEEEVEVAITLEFFWPKSSR